MLSWFFKKRDDARDAVSKAPVAKATVPPPAPRASAAGAAAAGAATPDWPARLQAAQGDDAALLALAAVAPVLDIKMAAVAALTTEAALRQVEREFRSHDRKVHRLAKQRLEAAVAQREARAGAQALLERAEAMLDDAGLPINHLVELDRAWEALPAQALKPEQAARFAELRARLDAGIRERGDAQQRLRRWTADARQALIDWRRGIAAVAEGGSAGEAAGLGQSLATLRATRTEHAATVELDAALEQALQAGAAVEARLAWFDVVPAEATAAPPPSWHELPAPADDGLARILDQRHQHWLRAQAPAAPVVAAADPVVAAAPPRPATTDMPDAEQRRRIEALVPQAEQALADGQLAAMQQHLQAIDEALGAANPGRLPAGLRARLHALHAEGARLKGWKQWGGARARDELAAEAEELARQTRAASDPAATEAPRLNLKSHAESIQALRQRWKELDHLGAVASQSLWHRFDTALQAAFEPVAAQHAALKTARLENLAAREALLAQLDALPLPQEPLPEMPQAGGAATDWKPVLHELAAFQAAWRKLGP
ncbi:MAG TPA: DUF349 domain-containing protein, partial [Rubrivivax sp.]|nr:DUF349 domain-containing protein [Rubrivivax sp.]